MKSRHAIPFALLLASLGAAQAQEPHPQHLHAAVPDDRVVLELSDDERAMLLEEMRRFLGSVQQLTGALGRQDMPAVAEAARSVGQKMVHEVPPALRSKLPQGFRQIGFSVHRDFDQIALDADNLKDVSHSLGQLSATLEKCVACHATYQIRTVPHHREH